MTLSNVGGIFAVTKLRLILFISLVLVWWTARIAPVYRPLLEAQVSSGIKGARRRIPGIVVNWGPNHSPRSRYNESKLALVIEPRPLPHLVPLVLHMISVSPPDWPFLFIGSPYSVVMLRRAHSIKHYQENGKINLTVLPPPWQVRHKEDVSRLLTNISFYDRMLPGVEWLFKFESDSILCANSERSLDDWLSWSWVGLGGLASDGFAGTGGLSIRKVSAVRRVLGFQERFNDTEPEDVWFMKRFKLLPNDADSPELATIEPVVDNTLAQRPMGYHIRGSGSNLDASVWSDQDRRKQILEYCPELTMIMDMKLERERCPEDIPASAQGPLETSSVSEKAANQHTQVRVDDTIQPPKPGLIPLAFTPSLPLTTSGLFHPEDREKN